MNSVPRDDTVAMESTSQNDVVSLDEVGEPEEDELASQAEASTIIVTSVLSATTGSPPEYAAAEVPAAPASSNVGFYGL